MNHLSFFLPLIFCMFSESNRNPKNCHQFLVFDNFIIIIIVLIVIMIVRRPILFQIYICESQPFDVLAFVQPNQASLYQIYHFFAVVSIFFFLRMPSDLPHTHTHTHTKPQFACQSWNCLMVRNKYMRLQNHFNHI